MVATFQVIIILIIVIAFIGSIAEKDKDLRNNLTAICIASIISFSIVTWIL